MHARHLRQALLDALADTPVVLLDGPRQAGKTTLVKTIADPARYLTLDEPGVLAAAASDPAGFVAGLPDAAVVDEIQRAPGALTAIKAAVDADRRPGRFLLTGSARSLSLPVFADALVGRAELHTLWPLSQGELRGVREGFVDLCFDVEAEMVLAPAEGRGAALAAAVSGGFPEAVQRGEQRRDDWFRNYLVLLLQREVRELAAIEGTRSLPDLLTYVATGTGQPLNVAAISGGIGIPASTAQRYLALLEAVFLLHRLPAWSPNERARVVRRPKLYLSDSGLLAHVLAFSRGNEERATGPVLETFVVNEMLKQCAWSRERPRLSHFRTHTGAEVDVVLEAADGRVVGIVVKATASPTPRDLRGMRVLEELTGDRFVRGVVLCGVQQVIPYGESLHALPFEALWTLGAG